MFSITRSTALGLFAGFGIALAGAGCANSDHQHMQHSSTMQAADMGAEVKEAVAVIRGTKGNDAVKGTVKFTDTGSGVKVVAHLEGLPANAELGFHIHEFGDGTAEDGTSAGGHYNPSGHQHGSPGAASHVGDMGNLKTDDKGMAHVEVTLDQATITGKNAILGRGVIVHGKADDLKSQPAGNAGPRIGFGVIGVAKVAPPPK